MLKVDCHGQLDIGNHKWKIGRDLSGEWVRMIEVGERLQVYYCNTLIRELDANFQRSTIVERWIPEPVEKLVWPRT